jgi:hypothetical protein
MKYVYKAWNASEQLFNTTGTVQAGGALWCAADMMRVYDI